MKPIQTLDVKFYYLSFNRLDFLYMFAGKDLLRLVCACYIGHYKSTRKNISRVISQPVFNFSKLTIETLDQGVKYL